MKLTRRQLRKMILEELTEVALCRSPKTGYFSDCKSGAVYSLSKKGADSAGVDSKYVKRGIVTKGDTKDGVPKTRAKYGMNTSDKKAAGRKRIPSGEDIPARRSVSKYPALYKEDESDPNDIELTRQEKMDVEYLAGVVRMEIQNLISKISKAKQGTCSLNDVIAVMSRYELASRGKLGSNGAAASA
jgi:hypothetical protein